VSIAFGNTGRSAGVLQHRNVVWLTPHRIWENIARQESVQTDVNALVQYTSMILALEQGKAQAFHPRQHVDHAAQNDLVQAGACCNRLHFPMDCFQIRYGHHPRA
jgi:hypothetical protein